MRNQVIADKSLTRPLGLTGTSITYHEAAVRALILQIILDTPWPRDPREAVDKFYGHLRAFPHSEGLIKVAKSLGGDMPAKSDSYLRDTSPLTKKCAGILKRYPRLIPLARAVENCLCTDVFSFSRWIDLRFLSGYRTYADDHRVEEFVCCTIQSLAGESECHSFGVKTLGTLTAATGASAAVIWGMAAIDLMGGMGTLTLLSAFFTARIAHLRRS